MLTGLRSTEPGARPGTFSSPLVTLRRGREHGRYATMLMD